jgi:hypothetical protein
MSSLNRKQKGMLFAGVLALVLTVSFLLADNAALRTKVIHLEEEMGVNREQADQYAKVGANIKILVKRAGESEFTLAVYIHNVMTTVGLNWIRDMLANQTTATASDNTSHYIAIGEGSGGGVGSTTLQNEFTRAIGTYAEPSATNWTLTYTWGAGNFSAETITEAGCFDYSAADAGTLLNYQDFTGIPLGASDSLQVQFEFDVS